MNTIAVEQRLNSTYLQDDYLLVWIEAFLIDRKAQNMSKGTLRYYQCKLKNFANFCEGKAVKNICQITPAFLREYLLEFESSGHSPGGCHAAYRTVKTFLRWWENEVEPPDWTNPISRVKAPKIGIEPLEPVDAGSVKAMMDVCPNTLTGLRDKALMLFLLDTGVRASELISINLDDVDPINCEVLIKVGKGRKPRTVFLGSKSRKALRV